MPYLVGECPRCKTLKITMEVIAHIPITLHRGANWQSAFDIFVRCRNCLKSSTWTIQLTSYDAARLVGDDGTFWKAEASANDFFEIIGFQSLKDFSASQPPEHVPDSLSKIFNEASTAHAVQCPNASAAMSRLCLDMVTKDLLPTDDEGDDPPNRDERNRLFPRLAYLFRTGRLPNDLKELADTIRLHGNDGAHDGTVEKVDAEDLLDFAYAVLDRLYTVPARVELAKARAIDRRGETGQAGR